MSDLSLKQLNRSIVVLIHQKEADLSKVEAALRDVDISPMLKIDISNAVHNYYTKDFENLSLMIKVAEFYENGESNE